MTIKRTAYLLCAGTLSLSALSFGQNVNTLSAEERAQGWQLLFDGKSLAGWHGSLPD